jgi:hypothetical protein
MNSKVIGIMLILGPILIKVFTEEKIITSKLKNFLFENLQYQCKFNIFLFFIPGSLMVGQRTLTPPVLVRIQAREPKNYFIS